MAKDEPDPALAALVDASGRLSVRVTPRARSVSVVPAVHDGCPVAAVRVTEPPDGGRANAAVVAAVAEALCVPQSAVSIERGRTARMKLLRIAGQ